MPLVKNRVDSARFNKNLALPYELRIEDFSIAMQDVYDFFYDVNSHLRSKGLERLDDMLRPAIMSGLLSDMVHATRRSVSLCTSLTTKQSPPPPAAHLSLLRFT